MKHQIDMSPAEEQASCERISALIKEHRVSNNGKLHIIDERSGTIKKNVTIDTSFQPESAVLMIISKEGDEQYFDQQGHEVFAD